MSERLNELKVELETLIAEKLGEIQEYVKSLKSYRETIHVQFADEVLEVDIYESGGIYIDTDQWQGSSC